jgi:hypothetical protein
MRYLIKDTLNTYLRQNGCLAEHYEGVRKAAETLLVGRRKAMFISELLDLYKAKKLLRVDMIATRQNLQAIVISVESAAELTLDEYVDLNMSDDPGMEMAYYELLSMID